MKEYQCVVCSYRYDPKRGDPQGNIPPHTPFEKLPEDWRCPYCRIDKTGFKQL